MSRLERQTTRPVTTPQSTAKLNIDPEALKQLPPGAKFESKQGNATATATIAPDGTIEITANCDSLTLLITDLYTEVHRFKQENLALKATLKEKETKGLSGWQNFQIYGFRLYLLLTIIYFTYKKLKRIWQTKL